MNPYANFLTKLNYRQQIDEDNIPELIKGGSKEKAISQDIDTSLKMSLPIVIDFNKNLLTINVLNRGYRMIGGKFLLILDQRDTDESNELIGLILRQMSEKSDMIKLLDVLIQMKCYRLIKNVICSSDLNFVYKKFTSKRLDQLQQVKVVFLFKDHPEFTTQRSTFTLMQYRFVMNKIDKLY